MKLLSSPTKMAVDSGIKARRSVRLAEIEPANYSSMTAKAMRSKEKKLDLLSALKDLSDTLVHARHCDDDGFVHDSVHGPASSKDLAAIAVACCAPPEKAVDIASGSGAMGSP